MYPWALTFALGAALCWGSAQVIGKLALRNMGVVAFNGIRFSVAAPIVLLGALLMGGLGNSGEEWSITVAVLSGILGWFCATFLFFYAIKNESAHRIIPMGNSHPFWAIVLATLLLGEGFKVILPISAALIFTGTFFLAAHEKGSSHWRKWVFIALVAAFLWGLTGVLNKYCLNVSMAVSSLLVIRLLVAAALFDLVAGVSNRGKNLRVHRGSMGLSIVSGIISFPVGSLMYLTALSTEPASALAPLAGTTIFFGFLLSIMLLGERPTKKSILGVILIFAGVLSIAA